MHSTAWRPTWFIRITLALHAMALLTLLVAPSQWRWVLAAVMANHLLIAAIGLWPRSHWLGPNWTQLPLDAAARNEIALTIDDGPDPDVTPLVLDILDQYAVRATFFCIGEQAARYPALCTEIVRRGHAVENHSQHHSHLFALMGIRGLTRELKAAQLTLSTLCGQQPVFFRAPAGLRNPFLDPVLTKFGLQLATWSVRGFDTRDTDVVRVTAKLTGGLHAGAILLVHDGNAARTRDGRAIVTAVLPALLERAATAGLHFVTLRQARSSTIAVANSPGFIRG